MIGSLLCTLRSAQMRAIIDTVNRLAGSFVLKPLHSTIMLDVYMITTASVVVASEQERQHV